MFNKIFSKNETESNQFLYNKPTNRCARLENNFPLSAVSRKSICTDINCKQLYIIIHANLSINSSTYKLSFKI